jgi:hypothetical protein
VEIVRSFFYVVSELIWCAFLSVIEEHTDQRRIISRRSCKSTVLPIIDLGKNSMSNLFLQSADKILILRPRFQKAFKNVWAVQRMRRN